MSIRTLVAALVLTAAAASFPEPAIAQPSPAVKMAEARRLFKAGARAYKAGKLLAAIQAFEQAYELAPSPALRFSAAQALRRQYSVEQDPALLRRALSYYRQYLDEVPEGRRRLDALKAVGALQLLLAQHAPPAEATDAAEGESPVVGEAGEPLPPVATRPKPASKTGTLSVDASVADASVSVDGKPPVDIPVFLDLAPGGHQVTISAQGYVSVQRQVNIAAGRMKAIDPALEEKPAQLTIVGFEDADVLIDGRPVGRTPLPTPQSLPSGDHRVVVGHNGYGVFVEDLDLERGEARELEVDLSMSAQRITAWLLFGGAAVAGTAGVVLEIMAASRQSEARSIANQAEAENRALELPEAENYNRAIGTRDNLGRIGGIAISVAVLSGGLGLLLYALDEPSLYEAASEQVEDESDEKQPPATESSVTARVLPLVGADALAGPGTPSVSLGLTVRGHF